MTRLYAWIEAHVFDVVLIAVVAFTLGSVVAHCFFGVAWPVLANGRPVR